jgi:hypothetical protein
VKYEEVYLHGYETVSDVRAGFTRYFQFFNQRRPTAGSTLESRIVFSLPPCLNCEPIHPAPFHVSPLANLSRFSRPPLNPGRFSSGSHVSPVVGKLAEHAILGAA